MNIQIRLVGLLVISPRRSKQPRTCHYPGVSDAIAADVCCCKQEGELELPDASTDRASCRAGLACWFGCNLAIAHLIFCDFLIAVDI
jgi:hypothetical protein